MASIDDSTTKMVMGLITALALGGGGGSMLMGEKAQTLSQAQTELANACAGEIKATQEHLESWKVSGLEQTARLRSERDAKQDQYTDALTKLAECRAQLGAGEEEQGGIPEG